MEYIFNNRTKKLILNPILRLISVYVIWILIHCASIYMYQYYCAYPSWEGLFHSLLLVNSPHCRTLMYLSQTGIFVMNSFWQSLFIWITTELTYWCNILKESNLKI